MERPNSCIHVVSHPLSRASKPTPRCMIHDHSATCFNRHSAAELSILCPVNVRAGNLGCNEPAWHSHQDVHSRQHNLEAAAAQSDMRAEVPECSCHEPCPARACNGRLTRGNNCRSHWTTSVQPGLVTPAPTHQRSGSASDATRARRGPQPAPHEHEHPVRHSTARTDSAPGKPTSMRTSHWLKGSGLCCATTIIEGVLLASCTATARCSDGAATSSRAALPWQLVVAALHTGCNTQPAAGDEVPTHNAKLQEARRQPSRRVLQGGLGAVRWHTGGGLLQML
jgi:hypothetical protein